MLKKKLFLVAGMLLFGWMFPVVVASVPAPRLSPSATFSLITDAPGEDLYMAFGHSALRLRDSVKNLDVVFNYGTFDFSEPNFYLKFARGKLLYALSDGYFADYVQKPIPAYTEQELLLTYDQKMRLFVFLLRNIQEENRKYAYDFFYDNCATRISDALATIYGDSLVFPQRAADKTFRDMLHEYLGVHPWMELGIDVVLGLPADKTATSDQQMFLPDYLSTGIVGATLNGRPLSGEVRYLKGTQEVWMPEQPFPLPMVCGWALLLCGIGLTLAKKPALLLWFDRIFFAVVGVIGVIIFFLWFLTEHAAAKNNLNLFWAYPWHVVLVFYLHRAKLPCAVSALFKVSAVSALVVLLAWAFLPQDMNEVLLPVILLVVLRSVMRAWSGRVCRCICPGSCPAT